MTKDKRNWAAPSGKTEAQQVHRKRVLGKGVSHLAPTVDPHDLILGEPKKYTGIYLAVFLSLSVLANIGLMVKYRVPTRFWGLFDEEVQDVPGIPMNIRARYDLGIKPKLAFSNAIKTPTHLNAWQDTARAKLRECLGYTALSGSPKVRVVEREQVGSLVRETLVFTQPDGVDVPAYLFLPDTDRPRPAVIALAGHSDGIVATAGIVEDDSQNDMALQIARAGYVVLTIEARGFGFLERIGKDNHDMDRGSLAAYSIHHGRSYPGFIVSDAESALAYLQTREEVDTEQIGAVGFSMGGKIAIYLAAINPQIKALVTSGSVMSFDANFRFARHGPLEAVIGLGNWLEMSDCLALVAPRPMLVHWGAHDRNRNARSAAFNDSSLPTVDAARDAYAVTDHRDRLETYVTPDLNHTFDIDAATKFLLRVLPLELDSGPPSS